MMSSPGMPDAIVRGWTGRAFPSIQSALELYPLYLLLELLVTLCAPRQQGLESPMSIIGHHLKYYWWYMYHWLKNTASKPMNFNSPMCRRVKRFPPYWSPCSVKLHLLNGCQATVKQHKNRASYKNKRFGNSMCKQKEEESN